MRGKVKQALKACASHGITPAYAGKRVVRFALHHLRRDHPRVCGEKLMPPRLGFGLMGSPPRMRGKVYTFFLHFSSVRITPAYAGKRPT